MLMRFINQVVAEVRRREVLPLVIAYAVLSWLILQVVDLTFGPLGFPESAVRLLIIIAIAGFPAVFFLAWIIDFKKDGFIFDLPLWRGEQQEVEGEETVTDDKQGRVFALMLCLFVIASTWALVVLLNDAIPVAEPEPTVGGPRVQSVAATPTLTAATNSIAVLAFENFDGQEESNYFANGLAEEILNYLASIRELNVAARSSSFRFRGERVDVREVAQRLNVMHVLEGSVRVENNRVRITAQLVDGARGFHIWSKSYDRDLDDIFAIQREIASAVVNELKLTLSVDSKNRLQRHSSENIDAYIFYLQGLEKLRGSKSIANINTANTLFNQALDLQVDYARAYGGICEAQLGIYEISNSKADFANAEDACEKAQNLSSEFNSNINVALGRLYRFSGQYQAAQDVLKTTISLDPTAVDAYIELGEVYSNIGALDEAEQAFLRAIELKRNYWKAHEALADYYYDTEQYDAAAKTFQVVARLTPDSATGYSGEGSSYWMLGDTERALVSYQTSLEISPSRQAYTNLGMLHYYAGNFEKAVAMQQAALAITDTDHRVWGRLAESYRFIPAQNAEARFAYQRAVELARENLAINEEDWFTRAILGLYLVHLGEDREGLDLLELALEQSKRNPEILYFNALALIKDNQIEVAISLLSEAVEAEGYYRQFIALDPDLQELKGNPEFNVLLNNK